MASPLSLSSAAARRFACLATGLGGARFASLSGVLEGLGYVQLDPLNICGRMHDLILRNRLEGYREGDLLRFVHSEERPGFEYFLPDTGVLVAYERSAWPFCLRRMKTRREGSRYYGRLSREEERIAADILSEMKTRGRLMSDDLDHHGRAQTAWGSHGRAAKTVLDKLFAHGHVLITERRGFRRVYDLPERVLPAKVLAAKERSEEDTRRWTALLRLRQRRLAILRRGEFDLVEDAVMPVRLETGHLLYILREDAPLLEQAASGAEGHAFEPLLLAPLDPIIYDRKLTDRLWDFSYTWEVYTPAAKRLRGYYALPVLSGLELVGHVEPRANREAGRLELISRKLRRGHSTIAALKRLGVFLGLKGAKRKEERRDAEVNGKPFEQKLSKRA
jgi:uncharacterized protein